MTEETEKPPTLEYKPLPPAGQPTAAGPVGCALVAMLTFAGISAIAFTSMIAVGFSGFARAGRPIGLLAITTIASVGGLIWLSSRWWRDPMTRSFVYGLWLGAVLPLAWLVGLLMTSR